ncbi:MAG: 50S ribosomal protein L13 [Rickettsiaceae bacterium]
MNTYSIKKSEIKKNWWLIDAKGLVLGRLASEIAKLVRGKHKPGFTPHMDCGDHVVVINAQHIFLSGKKAELNKGKTYYRHTGFPGGVKSVTAGKILAGKYPERVLKLAVQRMISRNTLGALQMKNLHIYSKESHSHEAQKPVRYEFAEKNRKNVGEKV